VALKVGVTIIKQVDVPEVVNPELKSAFHSVVNPLGGLVKSIKQECDRIDQKIDSFAPGTLTQEWLSPYMNALTQEFSHYKPSAVLGDLHQLYKDLISKLDVLNPKQLVELLESLYKKLEELVDSLNPESLTEFLNEKRDALVLTIDDFSKNEVDKLVNFVNDSIGSAEKLLGGLG
jgi:hypothetical protein